jgi:O-antigen biosynthesis protein
MTVRRALICTPRMPEHDREGGSRRTYHLIEFLLEAGWAVTLIAHDATATERYARTLRQRGVAVYAGRDSRGARDDYLASPDSVISAGRFDVAVLTFWNVGEAYLPALRSLSPRTRVVVDSIDLHFLRNARTLLRPGSGERAGILEADYASQFQREINTYAAADAVLAVSTKEAELINDFVGVPDHAVSVPLMEDLPVSKIPFEQRRGILFIGNYRHPPNREAVTYLLTEIAPHIHPDVLAAHPIYLVGNDLDKMRSRLGSMAGNVNLVGWVPSLLPYLQRCRITVVPVLAGAGTKTKLIQALTVGTPTVSTTLGAEGLHLRDGEHVMIADNPAAFASAIDRLVAEEDLWNRIALAGREHIARAHGKEPVRAAFLSLIDRVHHGVNRPSEMPA